MVQEREGKPTARGRVWEFAKNKYRAAVATTKAYVRVGAKDLADKATDGLAGSSEPGTVGNPTQQQITEGFTGEGKDRARERARPVAKDKPKAPDRAAGKQHGKGRSHS